MKALLIAVVFLASSSSLLSAQVYEWRDSSGSRNFTNDIEDVPEGQREQVRVVVRAPRLRAPAPESLPADRVERAAEVVEAVDPQSSARRADRERRRAEMEEWRAARAQRRLEREAPRGAQVVYDNTYRFARPEPAPAPQVNINIAGPLAVSQVVVSQSQPPVYVVDPAYDLAYEPLVSTSFDRGRFRHRTVRMRLQDQFQYDRNSRSTFIHDVIPLGPRFRAKLPRGVRSCATGGSRIRSILRR